MKYKSFNLLCVFHNSGSQTTSDQKRFLRSHLHVVTGFCLFACVCASVCVWLKQTDPLTGRAGWVWGLEPPSTHSLWRHTDSLTPVWTFGGVAEATAEARGQHSCSWQTMHSFAQSTERGQSPRGAHMSQHALHKPSCSLSCSVFHPHKRTHVQLI